jgi:LmbE family N-acetylglucosaminyl deacetylase
MAMKNKNKSLFNLKSLRKRLKGTNRRALKVVKSRRFRLAYPFIALIILLATTLLWSIQGARLQSNNADQLINAHLFENSNTFHNASWPGAHTFLLKWPLFLLIKVFGFSAGSYTFLTVGVSLVTVAALAAVLYLIERRPLIFGTICLALASVLLLVPAVPYAGAILPVNMAMLATRNLEYVLYVLSLVLLVRSNGVRSRQFWAGAVIMSLLMASDRLFFDLGIGGALIALFVYALSKGWNLVSLSVNWLLSGLLAAGGAVTTLWLLSSRGVTHIADLSSGGPYGHVHTLHDFVIGVIYGAMGLLTNFGANPAFDATIVKDIHHTAVSRLEGVGGLAFAVNLVILLAGLLAASQLIRASLAHNRNAADALSKASRLSVMLLWSALAALFIFIFSNHYYAVDARYLTIALFALFVAMAAYSRSRFWQPQKVVLVGLILCVSVVLGAIQATRTYGADKQALQPLSERNSIVAQVLDQHPEPLLVGDYWRVVPIKQQFKPSLKITPLSDCFQPSGTLTSSSWQTNLFKTKFAYLLSLDRSATNYPGCGLDQVIARYGRPNSSALIAGTLSSPKELLLFYDRGAHNSAPKTVLKTPSTILPIALDELPYTSCPVPTIMNVVAHEDDDLLFMSPDLIHDVQAGHCVRTVYVTAGDGGIGQFYWLGRQQGSQAAYSKMLGADDIWVDRIVKLNDQEYITVSNPRGDSRVSLIFLHLPDGSPRGEGFGSTRHESLMKLESDRISQFDSVDGQSTYTSAQLTDALATLMHLYQPAEIRTQANSISRRYPDHSDHMAVGHYTQKAYDLYETQQFEGKVTVPLKFYLGYPIHQLPQNVEGSDLQEKMSAFFAYANFDGGVCSSAAACSHDPAYGFYIDRQYTSPN